MANFRVNLNFTDLDSTTPGIQTTPSYMIVEVFNPATVGNCPAVQPARTVSALGVQSYPSTTTYYNELCEVKFQLTEVGNPTNVFLYENPAVGSGGFFRNDDGPC